MKYIICTILFFSLLQSCNQNVKYEMNNMLPEIVNVTKYVESGEYIPDSCEGRIDKLIKVNPIVLNKSCEIELEKKLLNWKNSSFKSFKNIKIDSLYKKTIYQYSYIIDSEPIHVYKTNIRIQPNTEKSIFIRLNQNGEIYSDFSENSWVVDNCN